MTLSEFGKQVKTKHPEYNDLPDEVLGQKVLSKYPQYKDLIEDKGFELLSDVGHAPPAVLPKGDITTNIDPLEQTQSSDPGNINAITNALAGGVGLGQMGTGALDIGMALPGLARGGVAGIRAGLGKLFTTPTSAGATQSMIKNAPALAKALPDVLTAPEQGMAGLGESVAQAARAANAPETTQALVTRGAEGNMLEPIQAPAGPGGTPNATGTPIQPNTSMLQRPISEGLGQSAEMTHQITAARADMLGDAIGNTLEGLDKTGSQFDARPLIDKIKGMKQMTASGEVATEGAQGAYNEAVSEALSTLNNGVTENGTMTWKDANQAKTFLQKSGNYAAKRFDEANEAYKTAASLIKDEIDNQAEGVIGKTGGNVQQFQQLRQAYAQTKFAEQATANTAAKEIGGGSLGQRVASAVVGGAKRVAPWAIGGEILSRMRQ